MLNQGNAKAQYSQAQIYQALIELMQTDTFEHISIKQIAAQAGVARNTFYRNFRTKEDILRLKVNEITAAYIEDHRQMQPLSFKKIAATLFKQLDKHLDFVRLLVDHHLVHLLTNQLYQAVLDEHLSHRQEIWSNLDADLTEALLSFTFGGFEYFIRQQISRRKSFKQEEWLQTFSQMMEVLDRHA